MEVDVDSPREGGLWSWLPLERQTYRQRIAHHLQNADAVIGAADAERQSSTATGPPNTETANESAAVSAERHRLSASIEQMLDLQAFALWLSDMLPYVLILLGLFLCKFSMELMQLLWLTSAQFEVNRKIRRQVSLKKDLQVEALVKIASFVGLTTIALSVLTESSWLWRGMALLPPTNRPTSIAATAFRVMVTDTFVRLLWTFPKLLILIVFKAASPLAKGCKSSPAAAGRAQGRFLTVAEHTLLVYRTALPTQVWYSYLLHINGSGILRALLTAMYLVIKCGDLKHSFHLLLHAVRIALRRGASYGTYLASAAKLPDETTGRSADQGGPSQTSGVGQNTQHRRRVALSPVLSSLAASVPGQWQQQQQQEQQQQQQGTSAEAAAQAGQDVEAGFFETYGEGTCPVCHDAVNCGVQLDCSHVFCDDCICEWLERHRTCPLCRAEVKPAGLSNHADGASSLLPMVF